jgi:hypothetical protein
MITMSEQINELAEALAKAQSQFKRAKRESENPFFKSKYADLESVFDACREGLQSNGLSVVQFPVEGGVTTMLLHKSGQWLRAYLPMPCKDGSPQAVGSAISYARRYALSAVLGIPSTDDDAEAAEPRGDTNCGMPGVIITKSPQPPAARQTPQRTIGGYPLTDKQQKFLFAKSKSMNFDFKKYMKDAWDITSMKDLTTENLNEMVKVMDTLKDEIPFAPETYEGSDKQKPVLAAILQLRGITDPDEMREISMAVVGTTMTGLADRVDMYLKTPL